MTEPRTRRGLAALAAALAMFLAALDVTIVGTAMPTIVGTLGGMDLYSWIFAGYLLTSTATVPVYGKLADVFGRKPVLLVGVGLFLAGSALCATARSIEQLVLFRAVQGVGAGAVQPVTTTLVGDLYPGEARGRVQGWFSSVWGIAAVVGPALGGLLVDRWDWRAVFLINVPLGLIALVLLAAFFHERVQRRHQPVDYAGFALLMGGLTFLLTSLLQSEALERPVPAAGFLASAAVLLAVFAWHERRVPDPMLPRFLFRQRLPAIANAANFLAGAGMTGVTTYLPVFVQGVLGGTATQAGAALTPMSIGWPLGSVLVGRFGRRAGLRRWAAGGAVLEFLAAVLLLRLALDTPLAYVMAVMLVMGLGLGFSTTSLLIAVQNHVPWEGRGAATAAMLFLRNLGAAIGVAAIGAVLNASLQAQMGGAGAGAGVGLVERLLRPGAALPAGDQGILREALVRSLHRAYGGVALIALAGLAVAFLLPRRALPGGSGRSGTAAPAGFGPAASVGLPAQAPTGRGVNGPRPSTDAGRPEVPRE